MVRTEIGARAAEAVAASPEKSNVRIAVEIGVSKDTVRLVREANEAVDEKRVGKDGKARRLPVGRRVGVNKSCDAREYMKLYMRRRRAAAREREAELAPSRPQPNDPPALVSFRRRLRETTDPEAQAALRATIAHLERIYGQRPGERVIAGEAILPTAGSYRAASVLHFGRTLQHD